MEKDAREVELLYGICRKFKGDQRHSSAYCKRTLSEVASFIGWKIVKILLLLRVSKLKLSIFDGESLLIRNFILARQWPSMIPWSVWFNWNYDLGYFPLIFNIHFLAWKIVHEIPHSIYRRPASDRSSVVKSWSPGHKSVEKTVDLTGHHIY